MTTQQQQPEAITKYFTIKSVTSSVNKPHANNIAPHQTTTTTRRRCNTTARTPIRPANNLVRLDSSDLQHSKHLLQNKGATTTSNMILKPNARQRTTHKHNLSTNQISSVVVLPICYFLIIYQVFSPLYHPDDNGNVFNSVGCGASAQQLPDVADQSSSAPQEYHQHNNILKFSVEENKPINTFVGTIRAADNQVPYLILPLKEESMSERDLRLAFNFNLTNGDITTTSVLDREHKEQYNFVALIRNPFAEIKCTIEILDVNDNAPKFLTPNPNETNIVIDMPEGQRGFRQVLPLAVDYDSPLYGIKEFRIISGNTPSGTFQLVEHEAPARSTLNQNGNLGSVMDDSGSSMLANDNPQLRKQLDQEATVLIPSQSVPQLTGAMPIQSMPSTMRSFLVDLEASHALDRENQSSYTLVVEAIDGGQPPQFGRLMVTVNVLDINDNDPVFHPKFYECFINENTTRGALVHRVQAYDADLDNNGQLSYYIKRHTSSSQQQQQASNSSEQNSSSNNNNNEVNTSRFNNANVKPRSQMQQQQQQSIARSTGGPQRNNNVDLQELNHKLRPQQTPSAVGQDQLFEMDPTKGEIYLVNQLDFETDQWHELTIEARDHGKPPRSSTTTVTIHVIDTKDDPPLISKSGSDDHVRLASGFLGASLPSTGIDTNRGEPSSASRLEATPSPLSGFYLNMAANWFSQMSSPILFMVVFVALIAVTFPVCLVKMKSRQPESDYNDTAGLTTPSNNGQTKPSPSHSTNNIEHSNGLLNDSMHHHHHDHHSRRAPNLNGSFNGQNMAKMSGYDSSSNHYQITYPAQQQRSRHQSSSSRHLLPDSPTDHHQMPPVAGLQGISGSRGGTMTLSHNHHHHHHHLLNQPGHHHSLDHHHHNQFAGGTLTNTLAYAHSHAMLLQQAHHHQSTHHLNHHQAQLNVGGHLIKGGTMNSIGTHNSAHHQPPSTSPMPATPNTIHSSVIQPTNMHHDQTTNHHVHRTTTLLPSLPQNGQLPPTPSNQMNTGNVFSYPPSHGPGSTLGCYPDGNHMGSALHETPGSTMDSCSSPAGGTSTPQPLDRWTDLGVPAQLVNTQDWCGTYNWDYLEQWTPEYHTLLPLIQADQSSVAS